MSLYCFLLIITIIVMAFARWAAEIHDFFVGKAAHAHLKIAYRIFSRKPREKDKDIGKSRRSFAFQLFLNGALLFIPFFSWGIYILTGSPKMLSYPFSLFMERNPAQLDDNERLVWAEVRAYRNPQNGYFIDELADLYLDAGRFQDALNTYKHAIAINGESVNRLLGHAIALTAFEGGIVSQQAEYIFLKVAALDPTNPQARIFIARGLLQNGKRAEAVEFLEDFLKTAPKDVSWSQNLANVVTELKRFIYHEDGNSITIQKRKFIADNVGKLVARLEDKPDDLTGWMMLINAWLIIGKPDEAKLSLNRGVGLLSSDKAKKLSDFAYEKGLKRKAN
ncbi:MAG: cytochrome c-type biogenesis protein CcmH [Candidatus Tokpelaia sp. JSC188]|nr:MAG: cytochrome c-type biogenesis protein CcmH [Candidatus Tokpelaia sp. JSC188]